MVTVEYDGEVSPCPLCNGVNTNLSERYRWVPPGPTKITLGVTLVHWCDHIENGVQMKGAEINEVVNRWNEYCKYLSELKTLEKNHEIECKEG